MSTLKTVSVIHPSGSVTNISNDSSGNVTIGNNLTVTGTTTLTGSLGNITTGTINSGAITSSGAVSGTSLSSSGTVSASTGTLYPIVSGTAQASTSGTSINFTGIPSWAKKITVMFSEVSTSSTSGKLLQLGTSGGVTTSGYTGGSQLVQGAAGFSGLYSTAGIPINSVAAADSVSGSCVFSLLNASTNIWVAQGVFRNSGTQTSYCAGAVTLSATLDRVRVTTVNGTDTFDAGNINILYE